MGDTQTTKAQYVQVVPNSTGAKIGNWASVMWIDAGDGNGPQLVTVYTQTTASWPVEPTAGFALERDDAFVSVDWQRQMLDELRAIRIGIERLCQSQPADNYDTTLLDEAQQQREEMEDLSRGAGPTPQ